MAQEHDRETPVEIEEDIGPEPDEAAVLIDTPHGLVPAGPIKLREVGIVGGISDLPTLNYLRKAHELVRAKIEMIHDLRLHAISLTTKFDWTVHQRESDRPEDVAPYLTAAGALKLRDPMRVDLDRDDQPEIVLYNQGTPKEYWGAFFHGRARCLMFSPLWHQVTGARFSNEGFFTRGGKIDANPGDVIKAAATNWTGLAIRKAIGLEQPAWEWLEKAGLDIAWIKDRAVSFKDGRHSSQRKQQRAAEEMAFTQPMLAVKLDPRGDRFMALKNAIAAAGGRYNLDQSQRWFLEDTPSARKLVSSLDLIGATDEIKADARV